MDEYTLEMRIEAEEDAASEMTVEEVRAYFARVERENALAIAQWNAWCDAREGRAA